MNDDNPSSAAEPRPEPAAPAPRRRRRPWTGLAIALLLLAVGGGIAWWIARPGPAPGGPGFGPGRFGGPGAQPVSVQAVQRRDVRVIVDAIGTLTASRTVVVQPQVGGVLQSLHFTEGGPVRAGQLLARIDPRAFEVAVGQAEGTLARDSAQLDNARADLARYTDLVAKDAAPRQQLDTQHALVRQLEGTVQVDGATLAAARLQLSYTRVLAPLSGRAGLRQVDVGNVVQPGSANGLLSITATQPISLLFAVPSAHLPQIEARLRAGQPLEVQAWDATGTTMLAEGRLTTVDNAIDPGTDTIRLKASFPNLDDRLFPNQPVSVRLRLDTLRGALAVPPAAVLRGAQGFYVYVVGADDKVTTRLVTPGPVDGEWMAVRGPLQPGDRVVTDGTDRLREGAKVEVIAADPNQRAGAAPPPRASGPRGALPPEVAARLKAMSPEQRRAWFEQRRAAGASAPPR
ncbi:MAG: efflux transporter periplasmic adaptor subunit [Rubrivivax sp. SCN 70-15]|nr:MAG: efflux transporter periplasmic adaptor subunit [Rubrivivax sp. SCN 70-15]